MLIMIDAQKVFIYLPFPGNKKVSRKSIYAAEGILLPNLCVNVFQGINTVGAVAPTTGAGVGLVSGEIFAHNTGDLILATGPACGRDRAGS